MTKFTFENWPQWFRGLWPDDQRRWSIINGYTAFATQHKDVLADIAVRNYVFAPIRESDPHKAAIAEGRRQCALEIFKLANTDPSTLFDLTRIVRTPGGQK